MTATLLPTSVPAVLAAAADLYDRDSSLDALDAIAMAASADRHCWLSPALKALFAVELWLGGDVPQWEASQSERSDVVDVLRQVAVHEAECAEQDAAEAAAGRAVAA